MGNTQQGTATSKRLPFPVKETKAPKIHLEITEEECRGRLENIKKQIEKRNLKALIVYSQPMHIFGSCGNVAYINGSKRNRSEAWLIVPLQGDPIMFARPMHPYECAVNTWISDVRIVNNNTPGPAIRDILSELGISNSIGGVGLEKAPYGAWRSISEAMPNVQIEFVNDIFYRLRAIKSPLEIEVMRKAARAADELFYALRDSAKPGEWGHEVRAKMKFAAERLGCDYVGCGLSFGQPAFLSLGVEPQGAWRKLKEGDQILSATILTYQGYIGHAVRHFNIGPPTQEIRRKAEATVEAEKASIKLMKPGNTVAQVDEACERVLGEYGLRLGARLGHGMGLDYAESPVEGFKDPHGQSGPPKDVTLKAGMVVQIHVFLPIPDTEDPLLEQGPTDCVGDAILITETGHEILNHCQRELMEL